MEWKGGPCAIICSAPPQASLSRCSGIQAGKKARWQPDLVPPLGAKVGATKLVCRGHQWHLDPPPHTHPEGAGPLHRSQDPPTRPDLVPTLALTQRQPHRQGPVGGRPEHLVQTQCLFALIRERPGLSSHPRCSLLVALLLHSQVPGPRAGAGLQGLGGPSSGSSQQPMQMKATPCY